MKEGDFKFIYGMEYLHRMFGRAIGVVFLAPALYFAARRAPRQKQFHHCRDGESATLSGSSTLYASVLG